MPRFLLASLLLMSWAGCSNLGASAGCTDGVDCPSEPIVDPEGVVDFPISVGCEIQLSPTLDPVGPWKLSVDPGPIIGGQPFGVTLGGATVVSEALLDIQQETWPGSSRNLLVRAQATVRVRSGVVVDGEDLVREVVLVPAPIPTTCRYDANGNKAGVGPFPECAFINDTGDGGNVDCIGLGGSPSPQNPCGEFTDFPISEDCSGGGPCDLKGKLDQCNDFGFCITGPLETRLQERFALFVADETADRVLFGFDDEGTGATLQPDDTWLLPAFGFEDEVGSMGTRALIDGQEDGALAFECTMGVGLAPVSRTSDSELIRFDIQ